MALRVRRNACPDIEVVANARKQLESEVAKHVDAIIDLKGRMNALVPISKLPPEILSAIFTEVAIKHYTGRPSRPCYGAATLPYKWITLTHVSRSWRTIALNTPRFWSRIVLSRPDLTREILARSKNAPLWVTANMSYVDEPQRALLDTIMKESSRLKELSIAGPARVLENLYPRWTGQANVLESLSLSDNNVFDSVRIPILHEHPSVPVLFQGITPNLRRLTIHHIAVGWDNPIFCSTLTSLTVVFKRDNISDRGYFGQLMRALANMSALESLELNEGVPPLKDPRNLLASVRRVTLPNLRKLSLISDALNCADFLRFVTLPPNTHLLVTGRTPERGAEELVRAFSQHLARSKPLLTARLAPVNSAQVYVRGWWTFLEGDIVDRSLPAPDVELYLDALPHSRVMEHLMTRATFLARVRRLEIQPSFSPWDWHGLFTRAPELRVLSVSGHPEGEFLAALSKVQREDGEQQPQSGQGQGRRILSPELHTVQMSGVRFGCAHSDHAPAYLEEMVDWLMLRCNEGAPIATLELRECINAGARDLNRLREVVADVVWDGQETWEEEQGEQGTPDEDMYYDDGFFPGYYNHDDTDDYWIIPF
ncbi:hypothetical protein LXA43DRAFT_942252 [Ganoderma leucocontextum]|nr:hypothetical protein LXA43DRAFT_942252 [Ganoderma leucocontextum]